MPSLSLKLIKRGLTTAGVSTSAFAITAIPAPSAPIPSAGTASVLFPSEQGAFKGLEVATQLVEASILQLGCDYANYDLTVATKSDGSGIVKLDGVVLNIAPGPYGYEGRIYNVSGAGLLGGLSISAIKAKGSYNIGSPRQELTASWYMDSPFLEEQNDFRGTIVKEYRCLNEKQPIPGECGIQDTTTNGSDGIFTDACKKVSTIIDYGHQDVQKHGYAGAGWWQQGQAWRQNAVRSGTYWKLTRMNDYYECEITVKLQDTLGKDDTANKKGFNQTGSTVANEVYPVYNDCRSSHKLRCW
jgi:hypothetical protein